VIRLKELIIENIWLKPKDVPEGIKAWARKISGGNIQKFELDQSGKVNISMPWHVSDSVIYQKFKLLPTGNIQPEGEQLTRVGWEADSPQGADDAQRKSGTMDIPEGYIVVAYGTYPKRVEIYAGKGAQLLLPTSGEAPELTLTDVYILAAAKQLKSFARPKFKPENYENLISKGLIKRNRAITIDGRNLLQDKAIRELLKQAIEVYEKRMKRYSPVQPEKF